MFPPPPGGGSGFCGLGLIAPAVAATENANAKNIAIFLNMQNLQKSMERMLHVRIA